MKIEANDKEVQDIFSLGYFKIPRFQRPYSWNSDEVESFWDDIILEKSENYFIGSMVVYQTKKPYFGIVDGQQRLTTITLILSAIRNAFLKIGEDNLAKGVHKYIEKANIDNEDEFVLKSETSFPYLQSHIQSYDGYNIDCEVGAEEKKLEIAFEAINAKMFEAIPELAKDYSVQPSLFTNHDTDTVKILKEFRDKVLSLKLVFIQLDSEDDAYLIFETLNARGRDLTTSDLVKNLVLKSITNTSISIDQSKESWNNLAKTFDNFDDSGILDNFLVHYWCSTKKYCTEKKLFSEIKKHVDDDTKLARALLSELASVAPYYAALLQPESATWKKEEVSVKNSLKALNLFNVKQQTAFTLALIRSYKNGFLSLRNLRTTLTRIENFHYCFNAVTSQRSSGVIASTYSKLAIELTKAKSNDDIQLVLNRLTEFFASKIPDAKEFSIKFMDLKYSSKSTKRKALVKYTLSRLVPPDNGGLTVDFERLTIEHILSEAKMDDSSSGVVSSIGNLVLIDEKTNSEELADKDPLTKIEILKRKKYPMHADDKCFKSNTWGANEVLERAEWMSGHIYSELKLKIKPK